MARKRMISPDIWQSEQVKKLTDFEFRLYVALISFADDDGRMRANPMHIAACAWPAGDDMNLPQKIVAAVLRMEDLRDSKDNSPLVGIYQSGQEAILFHPHWRRYQVVNRPSPSKFPPPPTMKKYSVERAKVTATGYANGED